MRSVTNQPPTTFAVASTMATKPTAFVNVSSAKPRMTIAPTMTMPWMKFVPDMSGVWSIVGTFEITSKPRNAARTRIVSSMTKVSSAHGVVSGRVTQAPLVISSSQSSVSSPSGARCASSAPTLRE